MDEDSKPTKRSFAEEVLMRPWLRFQEVLRETLTDEDVIVRLKQELNYGGTNPSTSAMAIRQKARMELNKLRGDYYDVGKHTAVIAQTREMERADRLDSDKMEPLVVLDAPPIEEEEGG
jgi:hypothetical protein